MKKLVVVGWVVALLAVGGAAIPGVCQGFGLQIQKPDFTGAAGNQCSVKWTDRLEPGASLANITWYYATRPDLSDRRRMMSLYRDDFSLGFRGKWNPSGPFQTSWNVRQDGRDKRQILTSLDRDSGYCASFDTFRGNVVLSTLVRPTWIKNCFTLGLRTQQRGAGRGLTDGYYVQNDGFNLNVTRVEGAPINLGSVPLGDANLPNKWYWYEFSLRTRGRTEVEVRVRIFDEKHQKVLTSFGPVTDKFATRSPLLQGGGISLGCPADYAEIYVDPWEARWTGRENGEFKWDTTGIPAGQYFLVAEIADNKKLAQPVVSPFKLEIGKPLGQMQALKADGE